MSARNLMKHVSIITRTTSGGYRYFDPAKVLGPSELERIAKLEMEQEAKARQAAARKAAKAEAASGQRQVQAQLPATSTANAPPAIIMQNGEQLSLQQV